MTPQVVGELLERPDRWPDLTEPELIQLISYGAWLAALKDDPHLEECFASLHAFAVDNLSAGTRRQIVADLGELLEASAREDGTCPMGVLTHWLLSDPHPGVVSTAALVAAQVMPLTDEDPLTGPRLLLAVASQTTDGDRQGAIVTGVASLGDPEVLALVDGMWEGLDRGATSEILRRTGDGAPTMAVIDFLVSRLERAADKGDEGPVGHVVASLLRLRQAVAQVRIAGMSGVPEIERRFPSWSVEEGSSPIIVRRVHEPAVVGEQMGKRLKQSAAAEAYPRLLPIALRAWGVEDAVFVDGVRHAVITAAIERGRTLLLDVPLPVEPMPDWDRDAVLTWGILNPFGPTKVQICRVPVDDESDALVFALHTPMAPVCLLLGTIRHDAAASTAGLLLDLAERSYMGEHVLLKGLPHWVVGSADAGHALDVPGFFRAAHTAALRQDLAIDGDLEALILSLHRLRLDARQEIRRQLREGVEMFERHGDRMGGATGPSSKAAYGRWLDVASDPGHVAAVSAHFLDCWNAAVRFQQEGIDS